MTCGPFHYQGNSLTAEFDLTFDDWRSKLPENSVGWCTEFQMWACFENKLALEWDPFLVKQFPQMPFFQYVTVPVIG